MRVSGFVCLGCDLDAEIERREEVTLTEFAKIMAVTVSVMNGPQEFDAIIEMPDSDGSQT